MLLINIPIKTQEVEKAVDGLNLEGIEFKVCKVEGFKIWVEVENNEDEIGYHLLKGFVKDLVGGAIFHNVEIR